MGRQPATQGHGKVWAHAATKGLSGSLVPPQPGSVLTSVTHVAFKGHKDAHPASGLLSVAMQEKEGCASTGALLI